MTDGVEASSQVPMRILVVDDERVNRAVMQAMLRKMGHETILAGSGHEALAILTEQHPDLVLLDVMMPVLSGYDTAKAMRLTPAGQVPIVFLTALSNPEDIIEGLKAGGDDYLHKPVHYELLKAKISALYDRQQLLAKLSRQNKELGAFKEHIEDDRNIAIRFMEKLSALERITDRALRYHLLQAKDFGGDLIAAARTPDDCLHIMLADSAGHGLAAALSIMPVVEPFYKMTAKGFDISSIVEEMNKRVRKYVNLPRYVAANVVSVDFRERTIRAWNGGCPDGLILDSDGNILQRFKSSHLPLGVVNETEFDSSTEPYDFGAKQCRLFMCSDGVTELGIEEGREFDLPGLFLGCHDEEGCFDSMIQRISKELHGQEAQDDIAIVMIDCADSIDSQARQRLPEKSSEAQQESMTGFDTMDGEAGWNMQLTLTANQLKHLDVVPLLMDIASTIEANQTDPEIGRAHV